MKGPAILLAVAILIAPDGVRADDVSASSVPAKARLLADRGRALHDSGDYASAIAAFTQAYAMAPAPALLFNLAQAYRLRGDCDDAALMYRRYLDTNPNPEIRALVENHLANVERCMHKLALHIPVETAVASVTVLAPSKLAVATAAPVAAPSRAAEVEKDVGLGLIVGGSAALAVATYYAFDAHSAADDVAAAYARGAKWKEVAPIDARGKTSATRATVFGVGGALGVAGGIVTYLIGRRTERNPVVVAPTPHGVEVGMAWAF